jgi:hypothetical protein
MSSSGESKLGTFSTLSIGISGMVGGGIFAVTGLTVEVTQGSAPIDKGTDLFFSRIEVSTLAIFPRVPARNCLKTEEAEKLGGVRDVWHQTINPSLFGCNT